MSLDGPSARDANNESSEVFDITQPGRRVKLKGKRSITSDDSLFAPGIADVYTINKYGGYVSGGQCTD